MENNKPLEKEFPDKLYFRIGEVNAITGLPSYVLRFWETEFKKINPKRTSSGQRLYRKSDIELILRIKHLLYEKKYTIKGAKQYLNGNSREKKKSHPDILGEIRTELENIRKLLF